MRGILLAAGLGTRLRPLTERTPKCLIPIHGKPLLAYWLDLLLPAGFERLLINTHYLPDAVREFVEASPWRDRLNLVHEANLLGTGGTLLHNRSFCGNEPVLVGHADNLTRFNVDAFVKRHAARSEAVCITMMTFATDAPQSCGIVEEDEMGLVLGFHEKVANPPGNNANAAVYILDPVVLDFLSGLGKDVIDLSTEVIPHFMGRIQTFHNADYHRDIGTTESLRKAELEFQPETGSAARSGPRELGSASS